jgi:hypothetical protein
MNPTKPSRTARIRKAAVNRSHPRHPQHDRVSTVQTAAVPAERGIADLPHLDPAAARSVNENELK